MRETIRSLQIYLLIGGLLSAGVNAWVLVSADSTSVARGLSLFGLIGAIGWLYVATAFKRLIAAAVFQIKAMLYFSVAYVATVFIISLSMVGPTASSMRVVFSFIVLWYIHRSVTRLSSKDAVSGEPIAA
jgi:hypothetical protein